MDYFHLISYSISHISMMGFLLFFSCRKYSAIRTAAVVGAAAAVLIVLEFVQAQTHDAAAAGTFILVMQTVIAQGTAVWISEFRDGRALFTGLTSSNYVLPGVLISAYVYMLTNRMGMALLVEILIHAGLLAGGIRFFRKEYIGIQTVGCGRWIPMCLMPSLLYLFALSLMVAVSGSDRRGQAALAMIFFLFTMYACYYLVFRLLWTLHRDREERKEREVLRAGIRSLRREENEIRETEEKIAAHLRKRGHLVTIMQQMMEEKDYDGVKEVLKLIENMTEVHKPTRYCDNAPINGVVVFYAGEAKEKQVEFSARLDLPEKLRVNDWELAVVLGNLLDNALLASENVKKSLDRSTVITARQIREQILIEVRNHCDTTVVFDEDTGLPVSNRGENHGIGMHSVAYFAEKNQCTFDCGLENNEFFARILI